MFWHGHPDHFRFGTLGAYWDEKMARNQARDQKVTRTLTDEGWAVLRLWDLDVLADPASAAELVRKALQAKGRTSRAVTDPVTKTHAFDDETAARAVVKVLGDNRWIASALAAAFLAKRDGLDDDGAARLIYERGVGTLRHARELGAAVRLQGLSGDADAAEEDRLCREPRD